MTAILNCPECGEEYLAPTLVCADCGVALVSDPSHHAPPQPVDELPPAAGLVGVRFGALGVAKGLSDALMEAGITHRIEALEPDAPVDPRRGRQSELQNYGVFVRERDLSAAQAVDRSFVRTIIPDLPEEEPAAAPDGGCPACGTPVASDARECPDCGLALIEVG